LALFIVTLFAARGVRDAIQGDLAERFTQMARDNVAAARRWYWYQAIRCLSPSHRWAVALPRRSLPELVRQAFLGGSLQDLRYAARGLRARPGFSVTAVLTLGIGIGATTAIFSVVNGVLLRPLPYAEPDRLVNVWQVNEGWFNSPNVGLRTWANSFPVSMPVLRDWEELNPVFQSVGVYDDRTYTLLQGDRPEQVFGVRVSSGVWQALGVPPLFGRTLVPDDDEVGAQPVAVLSYEFWDSRFGGDQSAVGATIRLGQESYTVVGVMPRGFYFPSAGYRVWTTFDDEDKSQPRDTQFMQAIARLKPGITVEHAQREMESITAIMVEARGHEEQHGVRIVPRIREVVGDVQLILLVLTGAVGVVLLIACANIANMLLVRAIERRRELAIRSVLGARRSRLLRQLMSESLVLSTVGGIAGVLVALATFNPLLAALPPGLPRSDEVALDRIVLFFTVAISVFTGLLVGSLPAFRAARTDVAEMLQDGGRGLTGGGRRNWAQGMLVVSEIALAFVLLLGAGLLVRSFVRLTSVERGFNAEQVLNFGMQLPSTAATQPSRSVTTRGPPQLPPDRMRLVSFAERLVERLAAVPGVEQVAIADNMPFMGGTSSGTTTLEAFSGIHQTNVERSAVSPSYFRTLGIPIIAGRPFTVQDGPNGEPAAIVSRRMAELYWPDEDPVGHRIRRSSLESDNPWMTVVGVAADVRHQGLDVEPRPKMYMSFAQSPRSSIDVVMKTHVSANLVTASAREAIAEFDPTIPIPNVGELESRISRSVAAPRFRTGLVSLFAVLAGLLAVIGVYGMLSYAMAQRTAEIGIRMALGANAGDVVKAVLRRGATLAAIGLAIGVAMALGAARFLSSFLFETATYDAATFIAVVMLLALAALGASYVPARRATKVDPVEALKVE
jgi:putative ABC transport system permease protein